MLYLTLYMVEEVEHIILVIPTFLEIKSYNERIVYWNYVVKLFIRQIYGWQL